MAVSVEPLAPQPPAPPTVEPAPSAPGAPPPVEPNQPQAAGKGGLPDALIQIPAMQALLAGKPPALSFDKSFQNQDEAKLLTSSRDALLNAGIGFYRSQSGDLGVMFNQFHIHGSDLQAADKAGKLLSIAPPFDSINAQVAKSGAQNPILGAENQPNGFAAARSVQSPPQSGTGINPAAAESAPVPKARQEPQKLLAARVKNLQPGAPTTGPVPGAGRFLNQVLKPVI